MLPFLIRRTVSGLLVLFGVLSVVFLIFNFKPGDPARMLADQRSSPEALEAIRKDLGLDLPMGLRYVQYLNDLSPISIHNAVDGTSAFYLNVAKYSPVANLELGSTSIVVKRPYLRRSYRSRRDVTELLSEAFPNTAILAVVAIIIALIIGITLGTVAAVNKGSGLDSGILAVSALGMAGPSFFMAVLIAWLGGHIWYDHIQLPWIPFIALALGLGAAAWSKIKGSAFAWRSIIIAAGAGIVVWIIGLLFDIPFLSSSFSIPGTGLSMSGSLVDVDPFRGEFINWKSLILPAITLGIRPLAIIVQLTRSSLLDVLAQDHVRTARAKGLTETQVVIRHGLRNALMPVLTAVSGWFASLLAGAVFVEYVFGWKGMGLEVFTALENEDFPVVMGAVLLFATIFVVINVLVDVLYGVLDPRVRTT